MELELLIEIVFIPVISRAWGYTIFVKKNVNYYSVLLLAVAIRIVTIGS